MSTTIELPKGDSLDLDFALQGEDGSPLAFDTATLTVKTSPAYTLVGTNGAAGAASFAIPAGSITAPGSYASSVIAKTGTTEQGTLAFTLKVTDHA